MQIVLLQDVKALGKKGDIVKVSDGYARNFILPKKLGEEATSQNLAKLDRQKAYDKKVADEQLAQAQAVAASLADKEINISIKVGDNGKLFGSVSNKEVAQAVKEQLGMEVDKKKVAISDAVKALGTYDVSLKLHHEVTAVIKLNVKEL